VIAPVFDDGANRFLGHLKRLGFGLAFGNDLGQSRDGNRESATFLRFQDDREIKALRHMGSPKSMP
jgi:hypothetical protein